MTTSKSDMDQLAQQIRDWAAQLGFQQAGISALDLDQQHIQHLDRWLNDGFHGDMEYMATRRDLRAEPQTLVPGATRIISLRMDYLVGDTQPVKLLKEPGKAYLSRYALGRDYHKLIRKRLQKLADQITAAASALQTEHQYRVFVDSAPVLERAYANQSGLGWIGKNTMLLNRTAGSWFFIAELFTDLPLPVDPPEQKNHCGSCTACLDICPTDAFTSAYQLDARRCISYLTIESKAPIPVELRSKMGNRIFGCDDCQLICPWNRFAKTTSETDFSPRHQLDNIKLIQLFEWNEQQFLKNTEGSPIRRTGYQSWLRNIAVALGNLLASNASEQDKQQAINALKGRQNCDSELVREHIEWALQQHNQPSKTASGLGKNQ
jgi:epoxyqueuosine reductase